MDFLNLKPNELLCIFYIEAQIVSIILLVFLLLKTRRQDLKETKNRFLMTILICMIIYFIGDGLWALAFYKIIPYADLLIKIFRMIYYIASGFATWSWFMYIEILMRKRLFQSRKLRNLLMIPILISSVVVILICIFGNPAEKSLTGYLTAGGLIFVPFMYMLCASINIIFTAIKEKNKEEKIRYYKFGIYPIALMAIALLQVYFEEIPIFAFGTTASLIMLFINDISSRISTDALTGINNKATLNKYLKDVKGDSNLYLLMIDIDYFKQINDKYGHIEGDKAIQYTADMIKRTFSLVGKSCLIARYGGDEFSIVIRDTTKEEIDDKIKELDNNLCNDKNNIYNIRLSIGYSLMESNDTKDSLIKRADDMLYSIKDKHHKETE